MDVHKAIIREKTGIFQENALNKLISILIEINIENNHIINGNKNNKVVWTIQMTKVEKTNIITII